MDPTLPLYEAMHHLSSEMLVAARANDWDQFCLLEREAAELRDRLVRYEMPASPAPLDEGGRARKVALIQQILAEDREIRSHTDPWLEHVRALLAGNSRQRAINNAYGLRPG
ncbi:flagellar protein FliT [Uliginosibacterium aquaticum]|uniref:Flagellar protein FliT n=1 Tax=Uliginosibacterium aquaticum TaxID=2731212 RepID=A0ABX2IH23_9RHOO|nr:flagellar protein FliT [Uliginosibacterium aquaticum]NSL55183.1 flagellar protein FliT [Uliginosibacterium aquaticum]